MSKFTILACLLVVVGILSLASSNKDAGVICLLLGVVLSGAQMSTALSNSDK
jgi:hypothetical protein